MQRIEIRWNNMRGISIPCEKLKCAPFLPEAKILNIFNPQF
jgi:hypothetical protein